jgi:hypothetical protein
MSDTFGDYEDNDALDTAPADPEQVAIKLHRIRRELGRARHDDLEPAERIRRELHDWDDLEPAEREVGVGLMIRLVEWGRRQGIFR